MFSLYIAEDPVDCRVRSAVPPVHDVKGRMVSQKQRALNAKFKRGIAEPWLLKVASDTFEFRKKPSDVSIQQWASYYDPKEDQHEKGWTDEELQDIVEALDSGRFHSILKVEHPIPDAPYHRYDEHRKTHGRRTVEIAIRDITKAYDSVGFDVEHAVLYERSTLNDERVIEALGALAHRPTVESEELVEA